MATYLLKAKPRDVLGRKVNKLREQSLIPAVLYGQDIKNQSLSVNKNEFLKVYNQVGSSSLIDLQVAETAPVKILIHDYQTDPRTNEIIHVDFYQIKEGKKITTEIELEFLGEAPAVKELGGILVKSFDEIEIECLPADLEKIETIQVDLSVLKTFADAIYVKDLKVPEGIKITENPEELVVLVTPPTEEKEEEKPAAEGEVMGAAEGEEVAQKKEEAGEKPAEDKPEEKESAPEK